MIGHVVRRGATLVLTAERARTSPDASYGVACLTCGAASGPVADDSRPVEVWAMEHARRYGLEHGRFAVTTRRYWRVDPVAPRVAPAQSAARAPGDPRPAAHARRPRRRPFHSLLTSLVVGVAGRARGRWGPLHP